MARNGSGTYILPAGNPVVTGTTIDSVVFNNTMNDVAATLTGSLPRNGEAGMTGPFRLADGTASVPAFGFNGEASTGLFRPLSGSLGITVEGGEKMRVLTNGNVLIGSTSDTAHRLQVSGTASITGLLSLSSGLNTQAAARIGYIASTDVATVAGVSIANYGLTVGGTHTSFGGPGVALSGYSGLILATSGTERLRIDSSGLVTIPGSLTVSGNIAAANVLATTAANRIVKADASGYIHNTYFNSSDNSVSSGVSAVMVKTGDNYLRSGTAQAVATFISGTSMNISGSSTSCSGNSATTTLATKSSTLSQSGGNGAAMTFHWSGQGGQPSWLWGSNNGTDIYVYNPSNFNVNYATSAGSAGSATTAGACSGNAATVTQNSYSGGGTYEINWRSGGATYYTPGITITPDQGRINSTLLNVGSSGGFRVGTAITRFESSESTPSAGAQTLSVAHGGGRKPDLVRVVLRCKTAEGGYAVGDEADLSQIGTNQGVQMFSNASNAGLILYRSGGNINIRNPSTQLDFGITNSYWRFVVYCHWL